MALIYAAFEMLAGVFEVRKSQDSYKYDLGLRREVSVHVKIWEPSSKVMLEHWEEMNKQHTALWDAENRKVLVT